MKLTDKVRVSLATELKRLSWVGFAGWSIKGYLDADAELLVMVLMWFAFFQVIAHLLLSSVEEDKVEENRKDDSG